MAQPFDTSGRRSLRFGDRDYRRTGSYFITLCCHDRDPVFGLAAGKSIQLTEFGEIVRAEWLQSEIIREELSLGPFVVMPDHRHGIVHLDGSSRQGAFVSGVLARPRGSLGSFIAGFKSSCTAQINTLRRTQGARLWQRNFRESYIRSEAHLARVIRYIEQNPARYTGPHRKPDSSIP